MLNEIEKNLKIQKYVNRSVKKLLSPDVVEYLSKFGVGACEIVVRRSQQNFTVIISLYNIGISVIQDDDFFSLKH